jgi:Glycosyl hydrolases family 15
MAALLAGPLDERTLDAIEALLTGCGSLQFPALPNGLYAAVARTTAGNAYTGYANTWVRDTVQVAHAAWERGQVGRAAAAARSLLAWFEKQAPRFDAAIVGESDLDDPMQRPHIRFHGADLAELPQWWPHAQNDALGYALWFLSRAALSGLLPADAAAAAVLWRFPRYFQAIRYWQDRDSGHWEEARKLQCSSVGAVVAGLLAFRGLCRSRPEFAAAGAGAGRSSGPHASLGAAAASGAGGAPRIAGAVPMSLDELLAAGRAHLAAVLPAESAGESDPALNRATDAALLFLVHPLRVVTAEMAARIADDVRATLLGPHGIRRYAGDSYWMADYKTLFDESTRTSGFDDVVARDRLLKPGTEAQWCLFDPVLSTIHGWRFLATRDPRDRELQAWHLHRALGQVTASGDVWGEGLCPEACYLEDSRDPSAWVPNDNTPLLWTEAALSSALLAARKTAIATTT